MNFLAALIHSRLIIAALHLVLTWSFMLSVLSKCAPRYLVLSLLSICSPLISIWVILHFPSWLVLPKYMNSILLSFIFRCTESIQSWTASIEDSVILIVSVSLFPSLLGLNSFLMLWSSADSSSVRLVTILVHRCLHKYAHFDLFPYRYGESM